MRRRAAAAVLALGTLISPAFAQDLDKLQVEKTPLAARVHMLSSRAGGNLALLATDEGSLLVDSEYGELNAKVRAAIAETGDRPIRYLVNTHWHFDHVGGNQSFAATGAVIIAHANTRRHMAADTHIAIIDVDVPASPPAALPVVALSDTITLHLGDEKVVLHPMSAHTDGDIVVQFTQANVLHVGDIFFNCGYPFIDVANGGSIDGMIASAEAILGLCTPGTKIIPGHGPLATPQDFQAYVGMLREFRDIIAREMATGKDLATIQGAGATAELDERWGKECFPPNQFTEMVFRSLQAQTR